MMADRDDFLFLRDWGNIATKRLLSRVGPDKHSGAVWLAACTYGTKGAEAACSAGLDEGYLCDPWLANTQTWWPQAISGFRVSSTNKDAVHATITDWRTNAETGHLTNIKWTLQGGNPSQGGSNIGGWGVGGGLRAKVFPCSLVPSKFMYMKYDPALFSDTDKLCSASAKGAKTTVAQEVMDFWEKQESVYPPNYCEFCPGEYVNPSHTYLEDFQTVKCGDAIEYCSHPATRGQCFVDGTKCGDLVKYFKAQGCCRKTPPPTTPKPGHINES